jgi:hypothetical protein
MEPGARVSERLSSEGCATVGLRGPPASPEASMTDGRMALVELLQKSGDADFPRSVAEAALQILTQADVEGLIGAGRHERTGDRLNYRNGYRERVVSQFEIRQHLSFRDGPKGWGRKP